MIDLQQSLDVILEDQPTTDGWHPLDSAMELIRHLQQAQQTVADLQHRLNSIKSRMAADLALAIRRAKPGLNVAVDKNGCKVGYKTKHLQFSPDVEQGQWRVVSPNHRFLREFLQTHRRATLLDADLSGLINAIVTYFTAYYRTLGEDVIGTGILMVEERRINLIGLAQWRNQQVLPIKQLNSRLARREAAAC